MKFADWIISGAVSLFMTALFILTCSWVKVDVDFNFTFYLVLYLGMWILLNQVSIE